jgi:hypothetical protein
MSSLPRPNIATVDYELLVEYRREMAKRARKPLDLDPQDYFAEAENEKMSKSIGKFLHQLMFGSFAYILLQTGFEIVVQVRTSTSHNLSLLGNRRLAQHL